MHNIIVHRLLQNMNRHQININKMQTMHESIAKGIIFSTYNIGINS